MHHVPAAAAPVEGGSSAECLDYGSLEDRIHRDLPRYILDTTSSLNDLDTISVRGRCDPAEDMGIADADYAGGHPGPEEPPPAGCGILPRYPRRSVPETRHRSAVPLRQNVAGGRRDKAPKRDGTNAHTALLLNELGAVSPRLRQKLAGLESTITTTHGRGWSSGYSSKGHHPRRPQLIVSHGGRIFRLNVQAGTVCSTIPRRTQTWSGPTAAHQVHAHRNVSSGQPSPATVGPAGTQRDPRPPPLTVGAGDRGYATEQPTGAPGPHHIWATTSLAIRLSDGSIALPWPTVHFPPIDHSADFGPSDLRDPLAD